MRWYVSDSVQRDTLCFSSELRMLVIMMKKMMVVIMMMMMMMMMMESELQGSH